MIQAWNSLSNTSKHLAIVQFSMFIICEFCDVTMLPQFLMHHVTNQLLRKWSDVFPQSVCFDLTPLSPCSLYVTFSSSPTQSHVHFLWGQRHVPKSRWLRGSGPVPGPRHTEPPWRPTSWRQQHQRHAESGGQVEPGLTLPCPLHHNVWVRSHSLTLTFHRDMRISMKAPPA